MTAATSSRDYESNFQGRQQLQGMVTATSSRDDGNFFRDGICNFFQGHLLPGTDKGIFHQERQQLQGQQQLQVWLQLEG
jgi:hypothetical protein